MPQKMLYWMGRRTVDLVARAVLDINILYHEELMPGPKIIAPNHPTTLDPFIITIVAPEQIHVLITESAFKAPVLGEYLRQSGHVPVVMGHGGDAFAEGRRLLDEGKTIAIFPEGALSPEGKVSRPHTGIARLAILSGAPVIPIGIALDRQRVRPLDTGIPKPDGGTEIARLYLGGPYFLTLGVPMRLNGYVDDREFVAVQTKRIMRHIIRLSRMSEFRIQGTELPKGAIETNAIGAISIPFEIPGS
ncbi:MAG TPA: lysophospholipid acyltransferase family protein [Aggregatilineales bacterium]|nr:lysophospholipid acyltransferase family protein [Aggregatilineales bacterium]